MPPVKEISPHLSSTDLAFDIGTKEIVIAGTRRIRGSLSQYTTISSAQVLALNATPVEVVSAPAAGMAAIPTRVYIRHPGGTAYGGIAVGEDLVLKYTNASGQQVSSVIETTGFLDQTTAQIRTTGAPMSTGSTAADITPIAAAPIVLHLLTGEITTGNFPLYVRVEYSLISTTFTS